MSRNDVTGLRRNAYDDLYGKGVTPTAPDGCRMARWGGRATPGHRLSSVTFVALLPDVTVGMAGNRRRSWVRVARVECRCGQTWGRTVVRGSRPAVDDVSLRGDHAWHAAQVRRRMAREDAKTEKAA